MTWARQVLHVARKDARMAQWLLLAFAAGLATATARVVAHMDVGPETSAWMMLLVALGVLLAAVLVHGDSPVTRDALWVTLPLHPSAVLAGKLLGIASIVVVGLVAQAIALSAHDIPAGDYVPHLGRTAMIFGSWLLAAAAVATLTTDLRTFVVVAVSLLIAVMMFVALLVSHLSGGGSDVIVSVSFATPSALLLTLLMLSLLGLAVHQYRTRSLRRGVLLAMAIGVLGLLGASVGLSTPLQAPRTEHAAPALHADVAAVRVDVQYGGYPSVPRAHIEIELEGATAGHRYALEAYAADVHREDGTIDRAALMPFRGSQVFHVPGGGDMNRSLLSGIVELTGEQADELRRGTAYIVVDGRIAVEAPVRVGTLRLSEGSTLRSNGRRLRVLRTTSTPAGLEVEVATSAILPATRNMAERMLLYGWSQDLAYAALHESTGRVLPVGVVGASGSGYGSVLPGPDALAVVERLQIAHDPSFRGNASDLLLEVRSWRFAGSYPARMTARPTEGAVR